jgi:hypothetical protein
MRLRIARAAGCENDSQSPVPRTIRGPGTDQELHPRGGRAESLPVGAEPGHSETRGATRPAALRTQAARGRPDRSRRTPARARQGHSEARVEDTFAELSEAGRRGRIRLGAIPTIAPYFLPGLLGSFAKAPDISVACRRTRRKTSSNAAAMARSTSPSSPCPSSPSISRSSRSLMRNCCSCARRSSAGRLEESDRHRSRGQLPLCDAE